MTAALNYSELYIGILPLPCFFFVYPITAVKDLALILNSQLKRSNLLTITEVLQSEKKIEGKNFPAYKTGLFI